MPSAADEDKYFVELSEDDEPEDELTVLWKVSPDYGELDHNVVSREADIDNGKKFSGWTNPLSWSDVGDDDDKILAQVEDSDEDYSDVGTVSESGWITPADTGLGDEDVVNFVQTSYDESEGPTKADNGDSDFSVVYREADTENGKKFSGWTNPLGWSDVGDDDDSVLLQQTAN